MIWHSPVTGRPLAADTPHSLSDGRGERWPLVEGIPYLRSGSEALVELALGLLDSGDMDAALVALLSDQDEWWSGTGTDPGELRELVARRDELTLREAMRLLRFGPVADYFAHRWSDPTFLAGLALLEAHRGGARTAFELAGGIGHYSRDLARHAVRCVSGDVVFAKCWLAKNWIAPEAQYVVFDAQDRWPIGDARFDLVHCQDAFYFLPEQGRVAQRMREALADGGTLLVGHLHNADYAAGAMGPARTAGEWRAIFPEALVYDERELRAALLAARAPDPVALREDESVEAWSLAERATAPGAVEAGLALPPPSARLRPNPLIGSDGPQWPSQRYASEYGPAATWTDPAATSDPERDRRLVDLPERW
ncbi:class I SAM-dependent methyltransferase [Aurantiacibacter spongiae]|uniref:Class I SAM-dependent methyltransferase n=1 Tax=Aurantiacibacter spongiae TaxID=2488860 RepID=A0A3N5CQ86_9SPHN|nr:class I SAM-dependent methyltransferase [Aurantiacibacter spongiae]RPF71184.1 class I SAM-dependent methyltransferase [Aurantiacibacter spongiae]